MRSKRVSRAQVRALRAIRAFGQVDVAQPDRGAARIFHRIAGVVCDLLVHQAPEQAGLAPGRAGQDAALPPAYAGGQIATGGRLGMLGIKLDSSPDRTDTGLLPRRTLRPRRTRR